MPSRQPARPDAIYRFPFTLVGLTLGPILIVVLAVSVLDPGWAPAVWALLAVSSCAGLVVVRRFEAAQRRAVQRERLQAMGQLAGGIAHDLNNALSPIVGFADLLLRQPDVPPATAQSYLQMINSAAQDAAAVMRRLRDLYGQGVGRGDVGPVDLAACVAGAVAGIQPGEPGAGIRVQADVAGAPVLRGDAEAIREMLASLVANAVEAMPQGGALTVRARAGVGEVRLEVSDTGVGMSEEVRRRCLEPFFSTKGRRGGGLGLPLVHVTVERHGGTLRIESVPGRGTTVTVRLPPVPRA